MKLYATPPPVARGSCSPTSHPPVGRLLGVCRPAGPRPVMALADPAATSPAQAVSEALTGAGEQARGAPVRRRPAAHPSDPGGRLGHDARAGGLRLVRASTSSPCSSASPRRSRRSHRRRRVARAAHQLRARGRRRAALHRRGRGPRPLRAAGHGPPADARARQGLGRPGRRLAPQDRDVIRALALLELRRRASRPPPTPATA